MKKDISRFKTSNELQGQNRNAPIFQWIKLLKEKGE